MALFMPGRTKCPLCGSVVSQSDDHIGFTYLGSTDPLIRPLDDAVVHRSCLNGWEHRDAFVQAWNRAAAATRLGRDHRLTVDRAGSVRYTRDYHKKPWWQFW